MSKPTPDVTTVEQDLKNVSKVLNIAKKEGLEAEVMLWAFLALKNNPQYSIYDALLEGLNEWVK